MIEFTIYFILFVLGSYGFSYLAKVKEKRNQVYTALLIVKTVLSNKLGEKATEVIEIWIEGISKVQDGNYSNEDKSDQFLRYIRLAASTRGVNLSDRDIETLHTVILSTFNFIFPNKNKDVAVAIKKFTAMNL